MKAQTYIVDNVVSRKFMLNLSTHCRVIVVVRLAGYLHGVGMAFQAPEHTSQEHVQVHGTTGLSSTSVGRGTYICESKEMLNLFISQH